MINDEEENTNIVMDSPYEDNCMLNRNNKIEFIKVKEKVLGDNYDSIDMDFDGIDVNSITENEIDNIIVKEKNKQMDDDEIIDYLLNSDLNRDQEVKSDINKISIKLQSYLEKKPVLAVNLLKVMGAHMRKQHSKFRDLLLYGKKGALYSTLIRLANSYGKEIDGGILISVPLTNQELSNYSATARESLNRMLSELRRADVIEYRGHFIFIKDMDYLRDAIQCENCGREICNIE